METLTSFSEIAQHISNTDQKISNIENLLERLVEKHSKDVFDPFPDFPERLTRKQLAKALGISLVTVDVWKKTGKIPAKHIGSRVFFLKKDVIEAFEDIETLKYRRM